MTYPEHIYDPVRIQLAQQLMEKELTKLFPHSSPSDFGATITDWRENPVAYHLEDGIRDFWNIFAGILESIKLKPTFIGLVTAQNNQITHETLTVRDIALSSWLNQLQRLDVPWSSKYSVGMALDAMSDHEKSVQRDINDTHSSEAQDAYPIVVRREANGSMKAMDGNRRSLRAGLYDRKTIEAYVIEGNYKDAKNYWVPVNDLMQLGKLYQLSNSDQEKQAVRDSLEILFKRSSIARINYETRLLKQSNPWAEALYAHPPTS